MMRCGANFCFKFEITVSGEELSRNWMILLGHRRLQYIREEP
jgi:hypothetical protein